nr:tRNA (adenosine(37)-N6)-threonylcarbamoyltransferase complex dimerization subunit type 1 TsaB [Frigidibacter sp. ROC022]
MILAFDTAGPHCAAALLRGADLLDARVEAMERGQAERLVDLLSEMLAEQGLGYADLSALACGTGPGNFTGVRIAVSAARGFALALNLPAHGVSRFEAEALDLPRPCLVALDARRGEVYAQRFGEGAHGPALLASGDALPLDGLAASRGDISGLPAGHLPPVTPETLARNIARIAHARLTGGEPAPPPAPLYLRAADAAPSRHPAPVMLP